MTADPLAGLDESERFACRVAERVLDGVKAEAWAVDGRQGAVDAMLTYPSGRRAAFEVTLLAADGALPSVGILSRSDYHWPAPGRWWWTIQVGSPKDIPRLRSIFASMILRCEAVGAVRPEQLRWDLRQRDGDLRWLFEESSSDMLGHADVPARDGDKVRDVMVVPRGRGGGTDNGLGGLNDGLAEAFLMPHMSKHLEKVAAAEADERHLFVPVHTSALTFPVFYGLAFGDLLPERPPPLPAGVAHLWVAPSLSRRVLIYSAGLGLEQHEPYND